MANEVLLLEEGRIMAKNQPVPANGSKTNEILVVKSDYQICYVETNC